MLLHEILEEIKDVAYDGHESIGVNTRDCSGDQPIHHATIMGEYNFVRELLDNGADSNAIGEMGKTPLHYAASFGLLEIVKLLLQHGASPYIVNEFSHTPIDIAKDIVILDLLKSNNP